jgi:hypothetical protein
MGKRSNFDRTPRDYYPTPLEAVKPLVEHGGFSDGICSSAGPKYIEPCAGDGRLVSHLITLAPYLDAIHVADIEPRGEGIRKRDVFSSEADAFLQNDVITNPPWDRKFLHPFISKWIRLNQNTHFSRCMWLLFDADWAHTKQSREFMPYCDRIISVGRVKWIEGSKNTGKDNCCWYRFRPYKVTNTVFIGR